MFKRFIVHDNDNSFDDNLMNYNQLYLIIDYKFSENLLKSLVIYKRFFWRALPLKISFCWRQRPKGPSPNMDISKQYKGGTL